jgi:hypothetical protein
MPKGIVTRTHELMRLTPEEIAECQTPMLESDLETTKKGR